VMTARPIGHAISASGATLTSQTAAPVHRAASPRLRRDSPVDTHVSQAQRQSRQLSSDPAVLMDAPVSSEHTIRSEGDLCACQQ
jgi:hypothetical protein